MNHRVLTLASCFVLLLLLSGPGLAQNPAGWWKSSSGSSILIWAKDHKIVITIKNTKGQRFEYPAQWIEEGKEFSYVAKKMSFTARFSGDNEIRVVNQTDSSVNVWTRAVKIKE